jgi:hypothetical protein
MKKTLIDVVYLDGTIGTVSNDVLDVLIATGKILRFKRAEGWVDIIREDARLRDYRNNNKYTSRERRASWPMKK